jgi:hypothetical protein
MVNARLVLLGFICASAFMLQACDEYGGSGDSGNAEIRLLNASIGYDSLDLYVSTDDDDEESLEIEAVEYGNLSEYVKLDSDTYTVKVRRNGASSALYTLSIDLTDSAHATLVASGRSGGLVVQYIDEDVGEPDPDSSRVSMINASGAGTVDVYLTDPSEDLEDASPIAADSATTLDSDSYRLRVTGHGDKDDLRLDVPSITLESEQVATVIVAATQGGVLVNAYVLAQQGELETYQNTNARIRGAVGLTAGSSATLDVSDTRLLTNAATGVIGNSYWQVDAGSAPVELSVNGTAIGVDNQSLAAGADYTLLVTDNAGNIETILYTDDNFLPESSGSSKVRLLHGMASFDQPLTLTVDFFPIIEGVERGQASEYVEVDGGLEYQYDVSNANTTENIWSRESVELQSGSVYTLFMSGGDPTVNGSLRKDR